MEAKKTLLKKLFIFGGIIAGVVVVVLLILWVIDLQKTARINILVAPADAKIIINGKEYQNGSHRMFPGEADIKISRDGAETKELKLTLTSGETVALNTYLSISEGADNFYKNADNYHVLKLVADGNIANVLNLLNTAAKVTEILPLYKTTMLSAGYSSAKDGKPYIETTITDASSESNCSSYVCLRVKTNASDAKSAAETLLNEYGFTLDDYEVFYEN